MLDYLLNEDDIENGFRVPIELIVIEIVYVLISVFFEVRIIFEFLKQL